MGDDNDKMVRDSVEAFNAEDADHLGPHFHPDVVFSAYGDKGDRRPDDVV